MANVTEETMLNWTSLQETMSTTKKRAMRALLAEYTSLLKEPSEGFVVKVDDPFTWDVGIYGPPSTPYWGGYFKLQVTFPDDYPFEPPKLKFKSRFWHPNVYHNGAVCMSILHDPHAEEIPSDLPREEKWNPTLSVRTVLLSLISILGAPNPDSPANPEASKMYRSWLEDGDQDYVKVIEDIVKRSKKVASRDGVTVPKTLEDYLTKPKPKLSEPLVSYSSDSDGPSSSDCSDLLSLPSSEDSDQEEFVDSVSSWIPSIENCMTSTPLSEATPSVVQDAHVTNPSAYRETNESSRYNEDMTSVSTPDQAHLNQHDDRIIDSNVDQSSLSLETHHSFATLRIHHEPVFGSNQGTGNPNRSCPEDSHGCRIGSVSSSGSTSSNITVDLTRCDQTAAQQPTTSNRKRRRPPHLQIFAQKVDFKKRKKQ